MRLVMKSCLLMAQALLALLPIKTNHSQFLESLPRLERRLIGPFMLDWRRLRLFTLTGKAVGHHAQLKLFLPRKRGIWLFSQKP